jgi:peptidoglycan/LPS O-acetylase OafA/YrhL
MVKKKYFPFLDGLRGIAIVWVILHHLPAAYPTFLAAVFKRGDLGVEIFFAISGFVVIQSLLSSKNLKDFFLKRIFRIFPGYYAVLTLIGVLSLFISSLNAKILSVKPILWSFPVFFYNYVASSSDQIPGSLNVFWSLCFEEQFYALLGILFLLTTKKNRKKAIVILYLGIVVLRMLILSSNHMIEPFELQFHTHLRLDAILVGCILFEFQETLSKLVRPFWFYVALAMFFILSIFHSEVSVRMQGILYLAINLSIGAMMTSLLNYPLKIRFLLSEKTLTVIGICSFEIYLLHEILIGVLVKLKLNENPYLFGLLTLIVSVSAGYLMHNFFTKPINIKLRQKYLGFTDPSIP